MTALTRLSGIGPKAQEMLQQVGIMNAEDLQQLGAVAAYYRVKQHNLRASLNLLWVLEGALTQTCWCTVARDERERLLLMLDEFKRVNEA